MMRLISLIIRPLTHTARRIVQLAVRVVKLGTEKQRGSYSLYGSGNHCGSWNCWHNGPLRCDRRELESRTLWNGKV